MANASLAAGIDTLGLVGDGDDLDLLAAIEDSFNVEFGDAPAGWETVGDLHEALLDRVAPTSAAGLCATSMAFYSLRRALAPIATSSDPITPRSRLADLVLLPPKRLHARLHRELGVSLPPITLSGLGCAGLACMAAGVLAIFVLMAVPSAWPALALLPLGWALIQGDPGRYGAMSAGDLARDVATRNFEHFAERGADRRPAAIWRALCALLEGETGRDAASIRRQTRFLNRTRPPATGDPEPRPTRPSPGRWAGRRG